MKHSIITRLTACLLCGVLLFAMAACGKDREKTPEVKEPEPFTFNSHVYNCFLEETMGEKIHQAYDNMIDAILEGRNSFECPDEETYEWMFYQVPYLCFPVVAEYVDNNELKDRYADGVGYLHYKIPVEEFKVKLEEFEKLITDILNEAIRTDYSDIEKMAALYRYFVDHYEYDYDTFRLMEKKSVDYIGAYHFFTKKTDVCQGISVAYSYLLMQAGVDACVVKGGDHQWSIVRLNGKDYHIDPTFAMGTDSSLQYFLMTDEQREATGYSPKKYVYFSVYTQDHRCKKYPCTDDAYSALWDYRMVSLDHERGKLVCTELYSEDDAPEKQVELDIGGFVSEKSESNDIS